MISGKIKHLGENRQSCHHRQSVRAGSRQTTLECPPNRQPNSRGVIVSLFHPVPKFCAIGRFKPANASYGVVGRRMRALCDGVIWFKPVW
ncbi:MAG: hypothetical protein HQK89_07125 [Nitrospirae bacterium]|nr:hypothetical protein [Nitrospirota bacterium]